MRYWLPRLPKTYPERTSVSFRDRASEIRSNGPFQRIRANEAQSRPSRKPGIGIGVYLLLLTLQASGIVLPSGWVWPTPNPAFLNDEPPEHFLQPTVSGRVESGAFGCTRNEGQRFHEGVDLFPIERDRRGEADDPIFAASAGTVVYLNRDASLSSYGKYLVLEHDRLGLPLISLYSHFAQIDRGLEVGDRVAAGDRLGLMGRSASYHIPPERAHLHFEIGLRLGDEASFAAWHARFYPEDQNDHGVWNGLNLLGFDPLSFYRWLDASDGPVQPAKYVEALPRSLVLRVWLPRIPAFVMRHPDLVDGGVPDILPDGWEIVFTPWGLPIHWTPLNHRPSDHDGDLEIVFVDARALEEWPCRHLVAKTDNGFALRQSLRAILEILFGQTFEVKEIPTR